METILANQRHHLVNLSHVRARLGEFVRGSDGDERDEQWKQHAFGQERQGPDRIPCASSRDEEEATRSQRRSRRVRTQQPSLCPVAPLGKAMIEGRVETKQKKNTNKRNRKRNNNHGGDASGDVSGDKGAGGKNPPAAPQSSSIKNNNNNNNASKPMPKPKDNRHSSKGEGKQNTKNSPPQGDSSAAPKKKRKKKKKKKPESHVDKDGKADNNGDTQSTSNKNSGRDGQSKKGETSTKS